MEQTLKINLFYCKIGSVFDKPRRLPRMYIDLKGGIKLSEPMMQKTLPELVRELAKLLPRSYYDDPKLVGQRIAARRKELGLSQKQLAFPGCSAAYVSRMEAGQRIPSLSLLLKLSLLLGTSPECFASGARVVKRHDDWYFLLLLGVKKEDLEELLDKAWVIKHFVPR